uniref:Uncharacterized protein n=1 Tax=Borreliella burgdorferi TaxID=139 RepID=O06700_BORBG|nr:unknown [Borreliella burgdorferi]
MQLLFTITTKTKILCLASKLVLIKSKNKKENKNKRLIKFKKITLFKTRKEILSKNKKKIGFIITVFLKKALSNIKDWVNSPTTKDNINSIIQKISFIQNIDPNNFDDIKKIESDLISYFEKNSDFKSINYWAEIIKNYFKKNNRLKDLQDFERFMGLKRPIYGPSP